MTTALLNKPAANITAVTEDWAKLICSYHIGEEGVAQSDKQFKYLMGGKGIYKITNNKIGEFIIKLPANDTIPGLPDLAEGVALKIPKLPASEFYRTIAFFKEVIAKKGNSEAMLQFYYDEANSSYISFCPDQEITGTSVHFTRHPEMDEKYTIVMDIHSHNSMGAFFSGVDNADEKETRLFGVIGELNKDYPAFKFRISVGGIHKEVSFLNVFDFPLDEYRAKIIEAIPSTADNPEDMVKYLSALIISQIPNYEVTVPEEWLDKCKKPTVPPHGNITYLYGASGGFDNYFYGRGNYRTSGTAPFTRTRRTALTPRTRYSRSGGESIDVDAGHYNGEERDVTELTNGGGDNDYTASSWVSEHRRGGLLDRQTTQELYDELRGEYSAQTHYSQPVEDTEEENDIFTNFPDVYNMSSKDVLDLVQDLLAAHPDMVYQAIIDGRAIEDFHAYIYNQYSRV